MAVAECNGHGIKHNPDESGKITERKNGSNPIFLIRT
jgi:hypothetical protein